MLSWTRLLGFGRKILWVEDGVVPPGHKMTLTDALHTICVGIITKVVFPSFVMKLFPSLRTIDLAYDELKVRSLVSSESY